MEQSSDIRCREAEIKERMRQRREKSATPAEPATRNDSVANDMPVTPPGMVTFRANRQRVKKYWYEGDQDRDHDE